MLSRVLEPEAMDSPAEAEDYDAMDHTAVNSQFVDDVLASLPDRRRDQWLQAGGAARVLDVGTGTALIPIEFCRRAPGVSVTGIDLSASMLALAQRNVAAAGLTTRIDVKQLDAKAMRLADHSFDAVLSNSIVHHIPCPDDVLAEMVRVLAPGGLLFVRDLLRPPDEATLDNLVRTYASDANAHQRAMFAASLRAALTLDEMRSCVRRLGLPTDGVQPTSDRHWTWVCAGV